MTVLLPGSKAPAFSLSDENEKKHTLKKYAGKKLILFFYPKDDTPACTKEVCNYKDHYSLLKKKKIQVLGVSVDTIKKHKKFSEKYGLPFPLLSDENHEMVTAYGVWGKKKFMGREYMGIHRTTFIIDEKGIIEYIIEKVDVNQSVEQVLELLEKKEPRRKSRLLKNSQNPKKL